MTWLDFGFACFTALFLVALFYLKKKEREILIQSINDDFESVVDEYEYRDVAIPVYYGLRGAKIVRQCRIYHRVITKTYHGGSSIESIYGDSIENNEWKDVKRD